MSDLEKSNTYRNDMYRFIRASIICFYTKCMKDDTGYFKRQLISSHIDDYLKFFEKLYINFYKE